MRKTKMSNFFLRNPGQSQDDDDPINYWKRKIGFSEEPVQDAQGHWAIGYGQRLNDTPGGPRPYATISEPFAHDELSYFMDQGGDPSTRIGALPNQAANVGVSATSNGQIQSAQPFTDINAADVQPPSLNSLGFNPDGDGEKWMALKHPIDGIRAWNAKNQAKKETWARYG